MNTGWLNIAFLGSEQEQVRTFQEDEVMHIIVYLAFRIFFFMSDKKQTLSYLGFFVRLPWFFRTKRKIGGVSSGTEINTEKQ